MAKKRAVVSQAVQAVPPVAAPAAAPAVAIRPGRPSALLDTRVVYCGDNLEPLAEENDVDLV